MLAACVRPAGPRCPHPVPAVPLVPAGAWWGNLEDAKTVLFNQLHSQTHVALPCGQLSITTKYRATQNFLSAQQRKKPQCH